MLHAQHSLQVSTLVKPLNDSTIPMCWHPGLVARHTTSAHKHVAWKNAKATFFKNFWVKTFFRRESFQLEGILSIPLRCVQLCPSSVRHHLSPTEVAYGYHPYKQVCISSGVCRNSLPSGITYWHIYDTFFSATLMGCTSKCCVIILLTLAG